jgi:hypothetical protein
MSIRPSSSADVARLVSEMASADPAQREAAAARLAVIGSRAVTRLMDVASNRDSEVPTRVAALQALESIGDARSLAMLRSILGEDSDELAVAAIAAIAAVARGGETGATEAFDALASIAVAPTLPEERRLAALSALDSFPDRLIAPIYAALTDDPAPRIAARATRTEARATQSLETIVETGALGEPEVLAAIVRDEGDRAKPTVLKGLIDEIRQRERQADIEERGKWMAVRGQAHQWLAATGTRLALYDLRETLEEAVGPLPVGFLAAASAIGDITCLEPLAAAWIAAEPEERWWREHVADAFQSIVQRGHLTRRHAALKRILERWPAAGVLVATARR